METTNSNIRSIINEISELSENDLIHLRFKLAQIDAMIVKMLADNSFSLVG